MEPSALSARRSGVPQRSGPEGEKEYPCWEVCWTLPIQRFSAPIRSANSIGQLNEGWSELVAGVDFYPACSHLARG